MPVTTSADLAIVFQSFASRVWLTEALANDGDVWADVPLPVRLT